MSIASASSANVNDELDLSFTIPTARGDEIDSTELGFTESAELIIQESPEISLNWPDLSWAALPEEKRIADVVAKLKVATDHGVDTIIDRAIPGINRDAGRIKRIAEQVKVNIIVLTGWYTLRDMEYFFQLREEFPDAFRGTPTLADLMVRDIQEGIADTGVRAAGIKVVSDRYGIREAGDVRAVFRHSSEAHRRTGAPLMTHTIGVGSAAVQQEVFAEDGVDLSRVLLAHMDRTSADVPLGDFERVLQRGSMLCFDGWWGDAAETVTVAAIQPPSRAQNIDRVVGLVERGYEKQLLLSSGGAVCFQDCLPTLPQDYAPYTQLQLDIIPALKERGVSDAQIDRMTVENPRRLMASLAQGPY